VKIAANNRAAEFQFEEYISLSSVPIFADELTYWQINRLSCTREQRFSQIFVGNFSTTTTAKLNERSYRSLWF
jgi:hypothetical protein